MNIVLLKTVKANTTISDNPQLKPLKMSTVHVNSSSMFSSAPSQQDMLAWNLPEQNDTLHRSKKTNQIMATVNIIWYYFNVHWHVLPNDPIHFDIWCQSDVSASAGALGQVCLEFHS